jgi:hypothetical protein
LNCFHQLLHSIRPGNLIFFRELVKYAIGKITYIRSNINLSDDKSIHNGKKLILSLKNQFKKEREELDNNNQFECDLDRQHDEWCKQILTEIKTLSNSLDRYELQLNQNNRRNISNSSSSSPPLIDLTLSEDTQSR